MAKKTDSPAIRKEMGRRLKRLRTWTGLSQKDFAITAKIDPQTYSKLERGSQAFSIPTVREIVLAHGVSADWLMAATDDEPVAFAKNDGDLYEKTVAAVDHYIRSLPAERSLHPETADKLKTVRFDLILGTVPSWEDVHGMRTILSRYERPRTSLGIQ